MKIRGSLLVTKGVKLVNPGDTLPEAGLAAISDSEGNVSWGHVVVLPLDLDYIYPLAGALATHLGKIYYSIVANASGASFGNIAVWTEVAGADGTVLTQAQIDAINAAAEPSASNPFATMAAVQNLTVKGTDTIANILTKSFVVKNNLWISSTAGTDSASLPVLVGDGIISTGVSWVGIGPFRGPIGLTGNPGGPGEPGPVGVGVSVQGTTTVANILIRSFAVVGNLWIASDAGIDSFATPVVMGDGLVSTSTGWKNIGPFRGPAGQAAYIGTYLIKGGVTWLYDYTFLAKADDYVIGGALYAAVPTIITLNPSDEFLDRTDVFVADAYGNIFVQEGVSSNPAVAPEVNESLLVRISHVDVNKNTLVPTGVAATTIYNENSGTAGGEFNAVVTTNNGATIDLEASGAYQNIKCIKVLNGRNEIITFTPALPVSFSSGFNAFTMRVKSLNALFNANITVRLYKNGEKVAKALLLDDHGYNYKNTTDWQLVSMSVSDFAPYALDFDAVHVVFEDPSFSGKSELLMDSLQYQVGVYVPPVQAIIEYTSQLINNGDGASPFLTILDLPGALSLDLQQICTIGYTTNTNLITQAQRSSGTRVAKTLLVELGDYDDTGNSTKVVINDAAKTVTFNGDMAVKNQLSSFAAMFGTALLTADRDIEIPNADGTLALVSDIPTDADYVDRTTAQSVAGIKTMDNDLILKSNLLFMEGVDTVTIVAGTVANQTITLPPISGTLALLSDITSYVHTQAIASGTWVINHGRNKYPSVTVTNSAKEAIDAVYSYPDANTVVVTVFPITDGFAFLN